MKINDIFVTELFSRFKELSVLFFMCENVSHSFCVCAMNTSASFLICICDLMVVTIVDVVKTNM